MEAYDVIKSNHVFKGKIVDIIQDTLYLPNGKSAIREVVIRGSASAILPVDADGNIIFVRQYRHPLKKMSLEIPAGMLDDGEDPKACAIRELEEETGFVAGRVSFFSSINPAVGFCTEIIHIFFAEELSEGTTNPDEDEFVSVEKYSLDEALDMVYSGAINDSKTVIALLAYKNMLNKNK